MSQKNDDEKFQRIQKRIRKIKGFYMSLITFVLVNLLLLILNLLLSPHNLWFYWVALIWAIVLIVQGINTFTIRDRFLGEEWEQKKIKELMDKERKKHKD